MSTQIKYDITRKKKKNQCATPELPICYIIYASWKAGLEGVIKGINIYKSGLPTG